MRRVSMEKVFQKYVLLERGKHLDKLSMDKCIVNEINN